MPSGIKEQWASSVIRFALIVNDKIEEQRKQIFIYFLYKALGIVGTVALEPNVSRTYFPGSPMSTANRRGL